MSYKGQVLRGEKWAHLMSKEAIEEAGGAIKSDVEIYLKSEEKVKAEKETKSKVKK
jgi:hypothetical protein